MKRNIITGITIATLAIILFTESDEFVPYSIDPVAVHRPVQEREFRPMEEDRTIEMATELIKRYESFRSEAYICPAGVPTIGWGETDPKIVEKGSITREEADQLLHNHIIHARKRIEELVNMYLLPHEMAALISFYYNVGESNFKNIARRINNGKIDEASKAILLYNKSNGKTLRGLTKRRSEEFQLFTS